jgi:hypothetical protein
MSLTTKYKDEPFAEIKIVPDFLPSPDELAFGEESINTTTAPGKKDVGAGSRDEQPG